MLWQSDGLPTPWGSGTQGGQAARPISHVDLGVAGCLEHHEHASDSVLSREWAVAHTCVSMLFQYSLRNGPHLPAPEPLPYSPLDPCLWSPPHPISLNCLGVLNVVMLKEDTTMVPREEKSSTWFFWTPFTIEPTDKKRSYSTVWILVPKEKLGCWYTLEEGSPEPVGFSQVPLRTSMPQSKG